MKKIIYIMLCFMLFIANKGESQSMTSHQMNHHKYWLYRSRLSGFMIGGQANTRGAYLPASIRGLWSTSTILEWGDATIDLGWYIATLATEYKLLTDNNKSTINLINELHGAIDCFNRLDYTAETYYTDPVTGAPGAPNLNGFFVRDDVDNSPLNYSNITSGGPFTHVIVNEIHSDYLDAVTRPKVQTAGGNDQLWHLMMGFRLVKKYVPASVTTSLNDPFMDGETHILKEVQNIVDRVFHHLSIHSWFFYNTVLNKNVPNDEGGNVQPFCFGAAVLANEISPPSSAIYGDHQDAASLSTQGLWMAMANTGGWIPESCHSNGDNYKFLVVAALSNTWPAPIIAARCAEDSYEHIPLLQQIIYGTTNLIQQSTYITLFNQAPCEGPYNNKNLNYPSDEWSSQQRFVHPMARVSKTCDLGNGFWGEANGLDYMLFHNLWYIANPANYDPEDFRISAPYYKTYPTSGGGGSVQAPFMGVSLDMITIGWLTVNANANVTYHSEKIYIEPNTTITPSGAGSYFLAYATRFKCDDATGDYSLTTNSTPVVATEAMSDKIGIENKPVYNPNDDGYKVYLQKYIVNTPNPTRMEEGKTTDEVLLIPNPTTGNFQIEIPSSVSVQKIIMNNVLGNKVWETGTPGARKVNVDVSDLPAGMYSISIIAVDGKTIVKKLVKN
jgi:hypothetical protein